MPRLSIDITEDEHRRLKASAALKGQSLKDYVLSRSLGEVESRDALAELAALLKPRLAEVDNGQLSEKSIQQVGKNARRKRIS